MVVITPLDLFGHFGGIELKIDPVVAPVKGRADFDLSAHPMRRPLCFHDREDFERFKAEIISRGIVSTKSAVKH